MLRSLGVFVAVSKVGYDIRAFPIFSFSNLPGYHRPTIVSSDVGHFKDPKTRADFNRSTRFDTRNFKRPSSATR